MSKDCWTYNITVHNTHTVQIKVVRPDGAEDYSGAVQFQPETEFNLASLTEGSAIRQAGERLFKALLGDEKTFLKAYRTVVDEAGGLLRVVLEINEALPEEFAKPWEFICVPNCPPNPQIWLATASGLSFSRRLYNPDQTDADRRQLKKIKPSEPLKVVLMVSRPTSQVGWFDSDQVEADLQAFANQKQINLIPASSKNLRDTLRNHRPQIFHFIGHGRLQDQDKEGQAGQLAFMIEGGPFFGNPDWKTAEEVVGLFPNDALPQVVILQACEGARQSESDAFASLASKLLLQGIPIVAAMQYEIPAGIANQFVCRLYEEIVVRRNPVDAAVQEARYAIAQAHKQPDFATPVIYMNVADGQLFEEAIALSTSNPEQIEQNYPFKFIFKNLSFERKNALVGAFLKCESLNNRTSRTRMIEALIPPIPGRVEREGKPRDVVFSILEECDKRDGGFRSFLEALKDEEEDSSDFQEVEKAIKDLPD